MVNVRVFPTSICINFQWVVIFCFIMLCLVMLSICDLNSLVLDINNVASKQDWGCGVILYGKYSWFKTSRMHAQPKKKGKECCAKSNVDPSAVVTPG